MFTKFKTLLSIMFFWYEVLWYYITKDETYNIGLDL